MQATGRHSTATRDVVMGRAKQMTKDLSMENAGLTGQSTRVGRGQHDVREGGLTLIELMTTLAVLVISLTLVAPAFTSFLRSNRLQAAQSELVSSLMLARSEAARQGKRVGIEALQPLADGGFAGGWRVWVDADASGAYETGEAVVREVPARGAPLTITSTPGVRDVVFGPSGFLVAGSAVAFNLCGQRGVPKGYRVLLEPVGLSDISEVTTCP
jgi:type IV fimbrial biogenesis protein FimT